MVEICVCTISRTRFTAKDINGIYAQNRLRRQLIKLNWLIIAVTRSFIFLKHRMIQIKIHNCC